MQKFTSSKYLIGKLNFKSRLWLVPAVLLTACLVFLFLLSNTLVKNNAQKLVDTAVLATSSAQLEYVITYSEEGFIPHDLEIPIGARVIFENKSTIPMWPASDPHPLHSDFGAFDARRDYGINEQYSFDFVSPGTFGFHNHRRSLDRGFIHVIDQQNPVPDISKTKSSQQAIRNAIIEKLDPQNEDSIFVAVDAIEADSSLAVNCHDVAHDLGHRAYDLYGFSSAMTYNSSERGKHASVQDICAGGYVHGILEEVFLYRPELILNPDSVCAYVPDESKASCFHGVGHAVMFANKRNIEESLKACRKVESKYDRTRCFEGVWMETFWGSTDHTGENTLGWELNEPLQPCIDTQQDAKPACYIYAPFGYLRSHPKDYLGAAQLCATEDLTESDTHFCLRGVGIAVTSHLKGQHLEETETYAEKLTAIEKTSYYEGVIGYARLSGIANTELQSTCALLVTDAAVCADTITNYR